MADKETEQIKKLNQTVHSKDTRERDQAYNEYVKQVTPTHNLIFHMVKAFFTGGIICCIGQFILNTCENYGLDKDTSGGWCSMLLIDRPSHKKLLSHRKASLPETAFYNFSDSNRFLW